MSWTTITALLIAAYLIAFIQSQLGTLSGLLNTRIDVLPALVTFVALTGSFEGLIAVSIVAGLMFDALSGNPLGITMLSLFGVGLLLYRRREMILKNQLFAQFLVGCLTGALAPLYSLIILFVTGHQPLVGWGSLWQWLILALFSGWATPVVFSLFGWIDRHFSYPAIPESCFRSEVEIKRGKGIGTLNDE